MDPSPAPLYEGKAKQLYATGDPQVLRQVFKDSLTAFDAVKKGQFAGKGAINCALSVRCFHALEAAGIPTHLIEQTAPATMLVRRLTMLPLEVVIRRIAAGSLVKRYGRTEGERLDPPLIEFYLKDDALHDPLLSPAHAVAFGLATADELDAMTALALRVFGVLEPLFAGAGITLVDGKLEFGRDADGTLRVGDEISADTCRLWDAATGEKLDKDRFRFDLGDVAEGYQRVLTLLGG